METLIVGVLGIVLALVILTPLLIPLALCITAYKMYKNRGSPNE